MTSKKTSRLYRLSDADGGVRDIVKMTYDDVWAIAVKGRRMSPSSPTSSSKRSHAQRHPIRAPLTDSPRWCVRFTGRGRRGG